MIWGRCVWAAQNGGMLKRIPPDGMVADYGDCRRSEKRVQPGKWMVPVKMAPPSLEMPVMGTMV